MTGTELELKLCVASVKYYLGNCFLRFQKHHVKIERLSFLSINYLNTFRSVNTSMQLRFLVWPFLLQAEGEKWQVVWLFWLFLAS